VPTIAVDPGPSPAAQRARKTWIDPPADNFRP